MATLRRTRALVTLVAVVAWAGALIEARHLPAAVSAAVRLPPMTVGLAADSLVRRALDSQWQPQVHAFAGPAESPFVPVGERPRVQPGLGGAPRPPASRTPLALSGVLLNRDHPQAILEGRDGGTRIAGVGDTLFGQTVVRIEKDRVVLRDRGGSYELTVQE
jgi:hypothetical protein